MIDDVSPALRVPLSSLRSAEQMALEIAVAALQHIGCSVAISADDWQIQATGTAIEALARIETLVPGIRARIRGERT